MKLHNSKLLKQIIGLLSFVDEKTTEKCHIMADNGYDESIIIGSKLSLLCLAKKLIEIVYYSSIDEGQDHVSFDKVVNDDGVSYISTDEIKKVFDEMSDVWPVCAFITDNDVDTQAIVKLFKTE